MEKWKLRREELLKESEWGAFKDFLNAAKNQGGKTAIQDHAICMMAIWTGLRRSELADLKVSDVHLDNTPYIVVRNGKGGKYREVLISGECKNFLAEWIKHRMEYLFVPQRGIKYTGDGIYRVWVTALRDALLPHRSVHKARHYYASKLHDATKDLKFVQEQLGHTSLNTTMVYTHIDEKQASKYLSDFDKKL